MPLSDIVNVQITRQTQSVSAMGFGIPMILGTNKNWNDLIRKYKNMQGVAADFEPYDPEYIAAQDLFSQPVTPPYIYIGRRTVDTVDISVETPMPSQLYNVTINDTNLQVNSADLFQQSVVTLSGDLVTNNLINVSLNGTIVGTVTSVIAFSTSFTSGTSTIVTVNGVALAAVPYNTSNTQTLADIATAISGVAGVTSATSDASSKITVVFTNPGNNTVNSAVTTGGSAPTATISEGGFVYASSNLATMTTIANAIASMPNVSSAVVSGSGNHVITVRTDAADDCVIDFFTVTLGSSQATATIVNYNLGDVIAEALVEAINGASLGVTAAIVSPPSAVLSITANVSGVPYTVAVSTNIANPTNARVVITQVVPSAAYNVKIEGYTFVYSAPSNVSTSIQVAAGLVALINSTTYVNQQGITIENPINGVVTAEDNGNGSFELNAVVSSAPFRLQVFPADIMVIQKGLIIGPYTPSGSVVTDLQNIQDVNDDWYALACTDRTSATVQAIAAWIETQIKIFGTASDDPNIINKPLGSGSGYDSTSIAAIFANAGYVRSFVLFNEDAATDYPECAWFGVCLPLTPGSETWMFKQLASISESDLDATQEDNAFGKGCNTYEFIGGFGITQKGTVAAGEYIDVIRGVDWLTSTIQTYVYNTLILNPKVPYTDSGITAIEAQIRRALELGVTNGFIAQDPAYNVIVPLASSVSPEDKAARVLNGVSFTATLAGAIQAVNITGTVSV